MLVSGVINKLELADVFSQMEDAFAAKNIDDLKKYSSILLRDHIDVVSLKMLQEVIYMLSQLEENQLALRFINIALGREHNNYILLYNAGLCNFRLRKYQDALNYYLKASEIKDDANNLFYIGVCLRELKRSKESLHYFELAKKLDSENHNVYLGLGLAYINIGKLDEAKECLFKTIELNKDCHMAYCKLADLIKFTEKEVYLLSSMEDFASRVGLAQSSKSKIYFALGKAYGDLKDYDRSFQYYKIANELKHDSKKFNLASYVNIASRHENIFTKELMQARRNYGNKSKLPIFIVGMPRSGTTLLEQILSSHSKIDGVGEETYLQDVIGQVKDKNIAGNFSALAFPESAPHMSRGEVDDIAKAYLAKLTKQVGGGKKIVNKLPSNYMYVGAIRLLFPHAKIIHCRRHPLDIFLSIYFQNFLFVDYSFDPANIVGVYKTYASLMKIWQARFPGYIYEVYYEEMLNRQEEVSRELIKFCGLDWEDACLDFHKNQRSVHTASHTQVRQRIYTSSMFKWKKYEKFIGSVKDALSEEIAEYEVGIKGLF